jgi:hypothetical protein
MEVCFANSVAYGNTSMLWKVSRAHLGGPYFLSNCGGGIKAAQLVELRSQVVAALIPIAARPCRAAIVPPPPQTVAK